MTCIIGAIDESSKEIYMGADTSSSTQISIETTKNSKVFIRDVHNDLFYTPETDKMIFGCTSHSE